MNKRQFLNALQEALSYELPEPLVRSNVRYYSDYIDSELGRGRSSEELFADLGDPRLIARTIIDAAKSGSDGIPNTADDRDFSGQIYGGQNQSGYYEGSSDRDAAGAGYGAYGSGSSYGGSGGQSTGDFGDGQRHHRPHVYMSYHNFGCLGFLVVILVISLVISIVSSALTFLLPVLGPLIIVLILLWFFNNIRGDQ